ncbi:MAG: hypothetical protein KJP15_05540 [Gammaproteobacteria bacterium]|nr:hypothetical protein [Gammaproteobacteria bacterium]
MNMLMLGNLARYRKYIAFTFLALGSGPAASEARFDELGRLFTDAAQREKLEAVRHGAYGQQLESPSAVTEVTVNGVMLRSGGESVVWVNGKSTLDGQPGKGVHVRARAASPDNFSVPIEVNGRYISMKPGQSWSDGSGEIKDNY